MADMTHDKAQATLESVRIALREQFDYPGSADRLDQLDSHLATVAMIIDHLFDEAQRH